MGEITKIWTGEKQREEKLEFSSGTTSTKQIRLSLIPHAGLLNAAIRFELGLVKHGDKAWNNLSTNQKALGDNEWLIERCSHIIEHAYDLIDCLKGKKDGDALSYTRILNNAGAIAWGGLVLGEAFGRFTNLNQYYEEVIENARKEQSTP